MVRLQGAPSSNIKLCIYFNPWNYTMQHAIKHNFFSRFTRMKKMMVGIYTHIHNIGTRIFC